ATPARALRLPQLTQGEAGLRRQRAELAGEALQQTSARAALDVRGVVAVVRGQLQLDLVVVDREKIAYHQHAARLQRARLSRQSARRPRALVVVERGYVMKDRRVEHRVERSLCEHGL